MEVGGQELGRITFELRADVAPKTAEVTTTYHFCERLLMDANASYAITFCKNWTCWILANRTFGLCALEKRDLDMLDRVSIVSFPSSCAR